MNYAKCLLFIIFLLCVFSISAQVNDSIIRLEVLSKNIIEKDLVFIHPDSTMTTLKYLGELTGKDKKTYKVLTSIYIWGLSHRATSRILVYDSKNQHLGEYGVGMVDELPYKIENNMLLFSINECKDQTSVNFEEGIPKSIFIACRREYSFQE